MRQPNDPSTDKQKHSNTPIKTNPYSLHVSSLNLNGLKNSEYMNYEALNSDILFVCETHHVYKDDLDEDLYVMNKKVSSITAIKYADKGRGSNGMAFIYNNDIVLSQPVAFYRNRIAVLELGLLVIIGVYMVFDDGRLETLEELASDIALIKELVLDFKSKQKQVVVTGDFNIDLSRNNNFSATLNQLMVDINYVVADIYFQKQDIDYTFCTNRLDDNGIPYPVVSWVDHLLMERTMKILSKLLIVRSTYNIGDHNCLRYLFESNDDLVTTIIVDEKPIKKNVSWQNKTVKRDYAIKLDNQLAKYDSFFKNLSFARKDNQLKLKLTKAIKVINDAMVWSKERVKNYHTKTKIPKKNMVYNAKIGGVRHYKSI